MTANHPNGHHPAPIFHVTGAWERPVVSRHGDATTLLLTIATRPADAAAPPARLPVDLALVLDRSGSMAGEKLELVKQATLEAVEHLGLDDTFSVVMFETAVQELILPTPGTADSRQRLAAALREVQPGASTNLHGGWLTGCEHLAKMMPWEPNPHLHRAVILTDGLANVGVTDPRALTVQASELRQRGITTSAMGVGAGFNEVLLSGMAEAGGGTFAYIGRPDELVAFFQREVGGLLAVIAPQPRLRVTFPEGMRAGLVNPFPSHRSGRTLTIDLRDMTAGDAIALVFDIETGAGDAGTSLTPRVTIELPHLAGVPAEVSASFEPLIRARSRDVNGHAPNETVQVQAARMRADRAHRDAMRLDREGRIDEARHAFGMAMETLAAAPATAEIVAERDEAERFYASAGRLSETTRKERVHRAMHRSRGQESR